MMRALRYLAPTRPNQARSITIFARCRQQNAIKPPPYKILFFGSDDFALSTLEKLHNSGQRDLKIIKNLEVVCLAHSNERNSVIYKYSQENDIPTHFWGSLPPFGYFDMGVIVSFGKMMPRKVIDSFELGMINVHGSLLPALRGASPIARAIQQGLEHTGVSVFQIQPGKFDNGRILGRSEPLIIGDSNSTELSRSLATIGSDLCLDVICNFPLQVQNASNQDESKASYAPKLTTDDTDIVWEAMTATTILCNFRAFGHHKAYCLRCKFEGRLLKLLEIRTCSVEELNSVDSNTLPGHVGYHKKTKSLIITCSSGYIACGKLSYGKVLSAVDFHNGFWQTRRKLGQNVVFESYNKTG